MFLVPLVPAASAQVVVAGRTPASSALLVQPSSSSLPLVGGWPDEGCLLHWPNSRQLELGCFLGAGIVNNAVTQSQLRRRKRSHPMSMKKLALGVLALTFLVPLVPAAGAQVVVTVDHPSSSPLLVEASSSSLPLPLDLTRLRSGRPEECKRPNARRLGLGRLFAGSGLPVSVRLVPACGPSCGPGA